MMSDTQHFKLAFSDWTNASYYLPFPILCNSLSYYMMSLVLSWLGGKLGRRYNLHSFFFCVCLNLCTLLTAPSYIMFTMKAINLVSSFQQEFN
jgi:hypothetical protein